MSTKIIERTIVGALLRRLASSAPFLQVVLGPRQVGKTTALEQVCARWPGPSHYASADLPAPPDAAFLQSHWEEARALARQHRKRALLVLDEVQKVPRWSEVIKALYEEDLRKRTKVRVALLGSSSLEVGRGVKESLAGRYELHFVPHWTWPEMRSAFGWTLEQWLYRGGYPGSARLVREPRRWADYINASLVESVLGRDVLQMTAVAKPALLRQLFMLATRAPAQIISYNKMLGQLTDAGNTVTLAHYVGLLGAAFLVSGLNVWSGGPLRQRASSPKLVLWNNALCSALSGLEAEDIRSRGEYWGRWVENAVGAHLLNFRRPGDSLWYWRDGNDEVDYVLERGARRLAVEVKSGRPGKLPGLEAFRRRSPGSKTLVVGQGGMTLETFFSEDPGDLL